MKRLLLLFAAAMLLISVRAQNLPTAEFILTSFKHVSLTNDFDPPFYKGQVLNYDLKLVNNTSEVITEEYVIYPYSSTLQNPITINFAKTTITLQPNEEKVIKNAVVIDFEGVDIDPKFEYYPTGEDAGFMLHIGEHDLSTYPTPAAEIWTTWKDITWLTADLEVPNSVKKGEQFTIKFPLFKEEKTPLYWGLFTYDERLSFNNYRLAAHLNVEKQGDEYICTIPYEVSSGTYLLMPLFVDWEVLNLRHLGYSRSPMPIYVANNKGFKWYKEGFVVENEGYKGLKALSCGEFPLLSYERNDPFWARLSDYTPTGFSGKIGVALIQGETEVMVGEQDFTNVKGVFDVTLHLSFAADLPVGRGFLKLKSKPEGATQWSDIDIVQNLTPSYPIRCEIRRKMPIAPDTKFTMGYVKEGQPGMTIRVRMTNPTNEVISGFITLQSDKIDVFPVLNDSDSGESSFKYYYFGGRSVELQPGETKDELYPYYDGRDRYGGWYQTYPKFSQEVDGVKYIARVGKYVAEINYARLGMPTYTYPAAFLEDLAVSKSEIAQEESFDIIADVYDPENKIDQVYGLYKLENETRSTEPANYELVYKFVGTQDLKIPTSVPEGNYTIILGQDETVPVDFEDNDTFQGLGHDAEFYLRHVDITLKQAIVTSIENEVSTGLRVYPNPVKDVLNIKSGDAIQSVEIFTTVGTLILKDVVAENEKAINMSHLSEGMYILKVKTESGTTTQKIKKD